MTAGTTVSIWAEVIGQPETGVWCDACLLPSAVGVHVVLGVEMAVIGDRLVVRCLDCGWSQ